SDRQDKRDENEQQERQDQPKGFQPADALDALQFRLERHAIGGAHDVDGRSGGHGRAVSVGGGGRGPLLNPCYWASQALKRCRSSSPLSAQNCGSTFRMVFMLSGAVGRSARVPGSMWGTASL